MIVSNAKYSRRTFKTLSTKGIRDEKCVFCLFAGCRHGGQAFAADVLIDQKDKQFSKKTQKVKVGDSVEFRNSDPFAHNIFSLSDTKAFDLGSYPQGQSKKVTFDKAGKVEVECSIHPTMQMVIEVENERRTPVGSRSTLPRHEHRRRSGASPGFEAITDCP